MSIAYLFRAGERSALFAWGVLIAGIVITTVVACSVKVQVDRIVAARVGYVGDQVALKIREGLESRERLLKGGAGLFAASGSVDHEAWRRYWRMLDADAITGGAQGVGFSAIIPAGQPEAHARGSGSGGSSSNIFGSKGERAAFTAIPVFEPFADRNRPALNYDMYRDPVRRTAMEQAGDTGRTAISGTVRWIREQERDAGPEVVMYVPVYRRDAPVGSIAQRRAALAGWVYSPLRINDLMRDTLREWQPRLNRDFRLSLRDGVGQISGGMLYATTSPEVPREREANYQERFIGFHGRDWLLALQPVRSGIPYDYLIIVLTVALGLTSSIFLFAFFSLLVATSRKAVDIADRHAIDIESRETALRENENRWSFALDGANLGVWDWDIVADSIFYSDRSKEILGCCGILAGSGISDKMRHIHPEDRDQVLRKLQFCIDGERGRYSCEYRMVRDDGQLIWVLDRGMITSRDPHGRPVRMIGTLSDISEERETQAGLLLAANVFNHAREAIIVTDAEANIIDVNEAFTRITGYERDEVMGRNPNLLSSGLQGREFYEAMWLSLWSQGYWAGEIWNRRKNGEVYAEMLTISRVSDGDGAVSQYVALFSDISSIKEHERMLMHIAHYDVLTGLPNRALLADRLQQAMAAASRRALKIAVVFIDLDGFKDVNDSYGHDVGDKLLVEFGNRMRASIREVDTLARLGGDEFVAVLLDLPDRTDGQAIVKNLLEKAAEPFMIGARTMQLTASAGITFYPQGEAIDGDQLLRQADQAMYRAKIGGKNRFYIFDSDQDLDTQA